MTTPGSRCGSRRVPEATTEATWDDVLRGHRRLGCAAGSAHRQRPELLRAAPRLRGPLRDRAASDRRRAQDLAGPTTPRPAARSNGSSRPSRSGSAASPSAADLAELQAQLDAFVDYYNHHRPHRGIGRRTPAERVGGHPAGDQPRHRPARPRPRAPTVVVDDRRRRQRRPLPHRTSASTGAAAPPASTTTTPTPPCSSTTNSSAPSPLDPTRRYQPSGRPRGGPRRRLP